MKSIQWKTATTALLLSAALITTTGQQAEAATYTYDVTENETSHTVEGLGHALSGHHLVWYDRDADWNSVLYYLNLETGEQQQITTHSSPLQDPDVTEREDGSVVIVWADKRDHDTPDEQNFQWDSLL